MANNKLTGLGLFAAGAAVGGLVALLLAPRAGKHTRWRLRNSANRTLNRLDEARAEIEERVSEWTDEASEALAAAKKAAVEGRERVLHTLETVGEHVPVGD